MKTAFSYQGKQLQISSFLRLGKGKTLLYLHGGACSKQDFFEATKISELNEHTICAFDFPGCGESPYPKGQHLDIDDLVEITHLFIQHQGFKNIVLVGHSMGGLIGLLYILKYGHIDGLISIEGNLTAENCVFSRKVASTSPDNYEKLFESMKHDLRKSPNKGFRQWSETLEKYSSPEAFYDYCPQIVDYSDRGDLVNKYAQLQIPTLYIYGSENKHLSFLERLREGGCSLAEIPKSNHFPQLDNPGQFYKTVVAFLHA